MFQTSLNIVICLFMMQICLKNSCHIFLIFLKIYVFTHTKILSFTLNALYIETYTLVL